jgi:hypothetical protein
MKRTLSAIAIALFASSAAMADDWDDAALAVKTFGCEAKLNKDPQHSRIDLSCDHGDVVQKIPTLQQLGVLNSELGQTYINQHEDLMVGVVMLFASTMILPPAYKSSAIDAVEFRGTETIVDDYGHKQQVDAFSFHFNRKLFQKIDWGNFDSKRLMKIAPGFRFGPNFAAGDGD